MVLKIVLFLAALSQCLAASNRNQVGNYFEMLQKNKDGAHVEFLQTDDKGSLNNCGPAESKLVVEWSPKILKTGQIYAINVHVITTTKWVHGILCTTIWLDDIPSPLYQDCRDTVCTDISNQVREYIPNFDCPVPSGFLLSTPAGFKFPLDPSVPLPSGKYIVEASLKNQDGVVIICAKGEVEVADDQ